MQTHHTPECSGKEIDWFRVTDVNRRINANEFCYVHCKSCGLLRLDNVPENLGDYYTSDYYALPTLGELINIAKSNPEVINSNRFIQALLDDRDKSKLFQDFLVENKLSSHAWILGRKSVKEQA